MEGTENSVLEALMQNWHVFVIAIMFALMVTMLFKKKNGENSLLARVFQTNQDLDSTLEVLLKIITVLCVFATIFVMCLAFHDEIQEPGTVLASAFAMATIAIRDMFGGGVNNDKSRG